MAISLPVAVCRPTGGCPSWQAMVSVKNFHRSARAPPAARRHAEHIVRCYKGAGHSFTLGLCRVPGTSPSKADLYRSARPAPIYPGSSSRLVFICPPKHMIPRRLP